MLTFTEAYGDPKITSPFANPAKIDDTPILPNEVEDFVHEGEQPCEVCPTTEFALLEVQQQFNESLEASVQLDDLKETLLSNLTNESFDPTHSRLLTSAIRNIVKGHDIKGINDLNLESAVVLANTLDGNIATINDLEVNLEASIVSGILKTVNRVKEEFSAVYRGYGAMQFRVKSAKEKVKRVEGKGEANFRFTSAHRLSINGEADIDTVIDGLRRSVQMAKELVSVFYPSVYQVIDYTTEAVENSIPPKGEKLSTEERRKIASDSGKKINEAFQKLTAFSDVGVVSGEAYLEINAASTAGADVKPAIKFKKGEQRDARVEMRVTKSDIETILKLTEELIEATNIIYSSHSGFYGRTVRRYEQFREAYRVNAGFLRKVFNPYPLLITYMAFLSGTNGIIFVPISMYQHFFFVIRAATRLTDSYFSELKIK